MVKKRIPELPKKEEVEKISFGFAELIDVSYSNAENDSKFFIAFLQHLQKFCKLTWKGIRTSQRHSFGAEPIDVQSLTAKAQQNVPKGLKKLLVLRATGNNHSFLGYRDGNVFQVIFIEYKFGDIYPHG
ncbi:MAG: hypothetical protein IJ150_01610 [Bacteroidales bacterium]|nr:hypothetical protein [Bacteroidales bacterium]